MVGSELAEYIKKLSYSDISAQAKHQAKRLLLDSIGTILFGSRQKEAEYITEFIKETTQCPESTIIGKSFKSNCFSSAFANAAFSQIHDCNDGHRIAASCGGTSHPGRIVFPVALAVGEKYSLSGKDLITAVVIGYPHFGIKFFQ